MSKVPSRQARLAHAAKHAELWNAGKKDEWVASWRTLTQSLAMVCSRTSISPW